MRVENIPISQIEASYNPRSFFDYQSMQELKASIKSKGVLVPLKVRPSKNGGALFELIYGERRLRAASELGIPEVPCLIDDEVDDATALLQKGIENISRGNLHYLEQGAYFHKLLEEQTAGLRTQEDVAGVFGVALSNVSQLVKVWNCLYKTTKDLILPTSPSEEKTSPSEEKTSPSEVGIKHALLLSKLHHKALNIESQVSLSLPDNKELAGEIITEFVAKCEDYQLKTCRQTNDENLSVKKLDGKIDQLVKELNDALSQRLSDERSRSCFAFSDDITKILIYNRDSSLLVNDFNPELTGIDAIHRRFGPCQLVVTSPPYFVGKDFDADTWETHLDMLESVIASCAKVLCPGGKFAINVADPVITRSNGVKGEELIMPHIVKFMEKNGLFLFARIIWDKGNYWANAGHAVDIQSPPTEYRVQFNWEYCFVFKKTGKREISPSVILNSRLSRKDWEVCADGVWHIKSVQKNANNKEASFPDELAKRLIKMYSVSGDIVLDPFSGLGTVALSSKELKRLAVMYELDEETWQKQTKFIQELFISPLVTTQGESSGKTA